MEDFQRENFYDFLVALLNTKRKEVRSKEEDVLTLEQIISFSSKLLLAGEAEKKNGRVDFKCIHFPLASDFL